MAAAASSSKSKVPKTMVVTCSYLPYELWEYIIKFLKGDNPTLKSLSIVCKPFFSITNRLRFSVMISDETIPYLPRLFERFPNLTSLHLTYLLIKNDFNALLAKISTFPFNLKSLTLSNPNTIPTDGLRALSKKMKNLTSLTCSKITCIEYFDLLVIADCFPSLEELILKEERSCYCYFKKECSGKCYTTVRNFDFVLDDHNQFLALPKLRKVSLYGVFIDRKFINYLRNNRGPFTQEKNLDGSIVIVGSRGSQEFTYCLVTYDCKS